MSHFVNTELKLANKNHIIEALKRLGHQLKMTSHEMPNGFGQREKVEFALVGKPIGFRKRGNEYEMVADFWGTGINRTDFVRDLKREYAKIQVEEICSKTGLRPGKWVTKEDGVTLQMVATKRSWG